MNIRMESWIARLCSNVYQLAGRMVKGARCLSATQARPRQAPASARYEISHAWPRHLHLPMAGLLGLFLAGFPPVLPISGATSGGAPAAPSAKPDNTKPKVTITAPVPAQRIVTNRLFAVRGTASDNVGVASVWLRLNRAGWTRASGTTTWRATVALTPGPNTVQAYSRDAAGNQSTLASVDCAYVVLGNLSVFTNGAGTITRTPSGPPEIGQTYTLCAKPAKGFGFVNWTDAYGNMVANNAALTFTMPSNLTLQANFVDNTPPKVKIRVPIPAQQIKTNGPFTVRGTASDNVGVVAVWLRLNSNNWMQATGTTNWSATVALRQGTNTVQAYSQDADLNRSTTDSVTFSAYLPPSLTTQPQGQTNTMGSAVTFTVAATGTTPLFYQWRKDGTDLADGGSVSGATTPALTLSNLAVTAAGNYAVVVSNAYGVVTSQVAALTVAVDLFVTSAYGEAMPATGANVVAGGVPLLCQVSSSVAHGPTQYVCTGWTLVGNAPQHRYNLQLHDDPDQPRRAYVAVADAVPPDHARGAAWYRVHRQRLVRRRHRDLGNRAGIRRLPLHRLVRHSATCQRQRQPADRDHGSAMDPDTHLCDRPAGSVVAGGRQCQ